MAMRKGAVVAVGLALWALVGEAYVLPGGSILRRMTHLRDEQQLSALKVEGTVTFFGAAAKEAGAALGTGSERAELSLDATALLRLPGRCRLEVSSVDSGKSAAVVSANGRKRAEGGEVPGLAAVVEQLCPILAARTSGDTEARATVERHLSQNRVELRKTSLGRFGGTVAYVLGDAGEGQPQFWVYKDTFLPARLKVTDAQGAPWDVRLLDYGAPSTGDWFPRVIEVYRGNEPLLRFTALRADARPKIDDRLL